MTALPLYQVDAFADAPFAGNPAAVCPLHEWLPDATLQAIAMENNLSETAFLVPAAAGTAVDYELRWFTPTREVEICGHATLASGFVLMNCLAHRGDAVRFESRSGPLTVARSGDRLELDFPARPPKPADAAMAGAVAEALRARPVEVLAHGKLLAVFDRQAEVAALDPDLARVAALDAIGVIATAPGDRHDFVSRFFAPAGGIPEDPVTGSAHCLLAPYWAARLGRDELTARQISARGGELLCRLVGERVRIAGTARLYLEGRIHV